MWSSRLWLSWLLLPSALGKGNTGLPHLPYGSGTFSSFPDDTESLLSPRQAPPPTNPDSATSTYNFWWPFPAATPPPTTTNSHASNPPILISVIPNSSVAPNSVASLSTTGSSTAHSSTSASSSSQVASSSGTPTPSAVSPSPFSFIDLVPAFAAVGVFILALGLWILYGCCTRRPRVRTDDGELICGPPYVGDYERVVHRDIEERGQEEQEEMLHIPKYGRRGISGQYRWPSFNQPPPFDPAKGFYVPEEYNEEDDGYFDASLITPQANVGRSSSFHTRRSSRSRRSAAAATGPSRPGSPPCSDSTSLAFLELYESDEDEEANRKAKETPWESLRHKSIKRGILEQVKKENKWMDSIRSSIAGGSGILSRGSTKSKQSHVLAADDAITGEGQQHIGRRRGHVRADSDLFVDPAPSTSTKVLIPGPSEPLAAEVKPLKVTKPKAALESVRPGVRRGFTWLKHHPESVDKFSGLPDRIAETPSKHNSRSRSSSPVKIGSDGAGDGAILGASFGMPACREFLPQSPSQLMSPPLESQMCFTPMPLTIAKIPSPTRARSRPKSGAGASPTKIPSARKGRRPHSPTPPSRSFPDAKGVISPYPEESRGRLLKKFPNPDFFGPSKSSRDKKVVSE